VTLGVHVSALCSKGQRPALSLSSSGNFSTRRKSRSANLRAHVQRTCTLNTQRPTTNVTTGTKETNVTN
jgi:hypothetical protein